MARLRTWAVVALMTPLMLVACGGAGDGDDDSAGSETSAETALTDSFRGVTAESIKLGFVIVDYGCLEQFVDFNRGNQQETAQVFVDEVNDSGGVLGRRIEPVYKTYCPLGNAEALEVCTALTEDEEVFATLGVFIDFSGDAQLCLARDHESVHIGHELQRSWIDEAPPALLLSPDVAAERRIEVLLNLVGQEEYLEGQKVAILADQDTEAAANDLVKPALDELGLEQGATAVLTFSGTTDQTATLAQLDSFIERWKDEEIEALVLSGLRVSAKQFVERVKAGLPDLLLLTDAPSGTLEAAQDAVSAGQDPNPYEGIMSTEGRTRSERWRDKSDLFQRCVDVYEESTGETIVGPDELEPGADGKRVEVHIAVEDFCGEIQMFKSLAEEAGADLTNESWAEAVHGIDRIELVTTEIASLAEGKYDADDAFRLVAFDSSTGDKGDWEPLTDVVDTSGG